MTEKIATKARHPLLKAWLRKQAFFFTPVSCLLVALGWQYYLHPRHIVRTKRMHTEGASFALRHLLFFGGLCSGLSWGQSMAVFLVYNTIASAYIFSQFAMSHTHLPVSEADDYLHWVEYAALHTTNVKSGYLRSVDWFMSFLNFQIEHHLFPAMPQYRFPIVSPRVKALFEKHGLPYDERSYFPCLRDTWMNLHVVGQSVDKPKSKKA
jgi:fatty acid desaturase